MDFKLIKSDLKKPLLWFGSITLSLMVVSSILLLSLPLETKDKATLVSQINLNFILVYLVCVTTNLSKSSVSLFYGMEVVTNLETKEKNLNIVKTRFVLIFISIFTIGAFFIEITSGSLINKISWVENAKSTWWIFFILLIINYIYLYLFFSITRYLIAQNEEFKKAYINFINNTPKKEVQSKD
ncbi:hypothetical protein [Spiroplasma monobiae]|uniref:Transmembrane protein n=1 Tax=Spiroplasma monobiae MQ-1 TaxID=1336748 RepID=A0A2K9LVH5_SPISQ|nr:hypothetical protein [Spiroplasma monobiae]AUM62335.1 hypothetical protein SMONO_v1c00820 [Spiroplasma monobiae MQ-1]